MADEKQETAEAVEPKKTPKAETAIELLTRAALILEQAKGPRAKSHRSAAARVRAVIDRLHAL